MSDEQAPQAEQDQLVLSLDDGLTVENWVRAQEAQQGLTPLSSESSAVKTALVSADQPGIVIKRFDRMAEKLGFERERSEYAVLAEHLGSRFVSPALFIEVEASTDAMRRYYMLQTREEGVHYKTATQLAQARTYTSMSEDEIEAKYGENLEEWERYKGQVLREQLTAAQLHRAQDEAGELCVRLKRLEERNIFVDDLDFFVPPDGRIRLIDWQIQDTSHEAQDTSAHPGGSKAIELIFALS